LICVERVTLDRLKDAYAIVREYYEAVDVVVRDDADQFAREYFAAGSGIWLASEGAAIVGCIALRPLPQLAEAGEVKRLYVRPEMRGRKIADRLLEALEEYAAEFGYRTLYLDTKDDLLAAIKFYERHGYERCERYNDNPQATIFMRKGLGTGRPGTCASRHR
jgi:GNAT superfamily N-acetyltransferase